jgi:hypothetical protein
LTTIKQRLRVTKDPDVVRELKRLSELTPVPQAAYLPEALDDLLKKHAATLRKAAK